MSLAGARDSVRARLREATRDVHERMHAHAGFAAAATGEASRADYTRLLARLWGFHSPFDAQTGAAVTRLRLPLDSAAYARAQHISADLVWLGLSEADITALPRCAALQPPASSAELFGALYVIEGSTLGGVQMARAVAPMLAAQGAGESDGRRFFLGHGPSHGAMWRSFLARLEDAAADPADSRRIVAGAQRTFGVFEDWMSGWR